MRRRLWEVIHSELPLPGPRAQYHKYVVNGQVWWGLVRSTSNGPSILRSYPVDGRRRVRSEDEWDPSVYSCCVVGSSMLNGSWSQDQVDRGGEPYSCRGDARLQLATAAIASAEAVGMEGDLDDLMSSEEDSMNQGEEDRPRTQ